MSTGEPAHAAEEDAAARLDPGAAGHRAMQTICDELADPKYVRGRCSRRWCVQVTSVANPAAVFIGIDPSAQFPVSPQLTGINVASLDYCAMRRKCSRATTLAMAPLSGRRAMPKLRFDPNTYQFYYRCGPQDGATPKAAGFGWDPVRRRYFTEDPNVAASLESHGDFYARLLLADVLGAVTSPQHLQRGRGSSQRAPQTRATAISSSTIH
jgi:hypothetical protein